MMKKGYFAFIKKNQILKQNGEVLAYSIEVVDDLGD